MTNTLRSSIGPVAAMVFACGLMAGCGRSTRGDFDPGLAHIAWRISEAEPAASNPLGLTAEVFETDRNAKLRCRLTNMSSEPVRILERQLPCRVSHSFSVTGVTVGREFLFVSPGPVSILFEEENDPEITLAAGESWAGELDLRNVYPLDENSRRSDVLLLWSYAHDQHVNTGITLLPKK